MRLSNVKTRGETGLDHVMQSINVLTPFGKKRMKEIKPFMPGEEEGLSEEFRKLEELLLLAENKPQIAEELAETFMDMKDVSFTIERSKGNALSVVELFEVKSLLLKMKRITELLVASESKLSEEFLLTDTGSLLDTLDPRRDRMYTFYIYDDFSETLGELRKRKREIEIRLRKIQKEIKLEIDRHYGITLTPKFDYTVSKSNKELVKIIKEIPELVAGDEDYLSVTFHLKGTEETDAVNLEMDQLNERIEEEELIIREKLSEEIFRTSPILLENCSKIGALDFTLAKAVYAKQHSCIKPELVRDHLIEIEDGRHLVVEEILNAKKKDYCPVSIKLFDGVTCITGANMGGKTVSLKLVGLVAILTQYGFFVPCKTAKVGLSNYIHILIGDSQSVQRGLSSFGSEMEELKEILDNSKDRSLLLIDEIASGTNPVEGLALTKSLVAYLKARPYISLITTHFDSVAVGEDIRNMQVRGLEQADFQKLEKELRYANRRERIEIIQKYMDYRLYQADNGEEIPKDALNIAKMLGIYDEIIENAKRYLKDGHS
ncbi:MAG: mismatch repair protein MutS [Bacillota bacterium]|jgi:dsDNA-specific endonuclease/ATPase MutS2|nr:mismatch repair protein MutS [Bacillota bacterium]